MPTGPQGQKRPADVISNAVKIAKIATGEVEDATLEHPEKAKGGTAGGESRAKKLTAKQRSEIASKAAKARWKK